MDHLLRKGGGEFRLPVSTLFFLISSECKSNLSMDSIFAEKSLALIDPLVTLYTSREEFYRFIDLVLKFT